ncbi:MAG: AAA family ATPase [Lachnospiraceae bacterium]|nr:AAA family ATPase [Lachnospiraceae bacterium]
MQIHESFGCDFAQDTGFGQLDTLTGGFKGGDVILLGGRPAIGKSSFLYTLIQHICGKQGRSCVLFSNDTINVVIRRLIRQHTGLFYPDALKEEFLLALQRVYSFDLSISDSDTDIADIIRRCKRLNTYHKLIMIDDLQMIGLSGNYGHTREMKKEILWTLKAFALNNDCVFLVTSQLGRGPEYRTDHRPRIRDLYLSKDFGDYVDQILLLYRDIYDPQRIRNEHAIIELVYHKNGKKAPVDLWYDIEKEGFKA